jgi:hypothetical protein
MVVRNILPEDDDQVLDRRRRERLVAGPLTVVVCERSCRHGKCGHETTRNDWMFHRIAPDF